MYGQIVELEGNGDDSVFSACWGLENFLLIIITYVRQRGRKIKAHYFKFHFLD